MREVFQNWTLIKAVNFYELPFFLKNGLDEIEVEKIIDLEEFIYQYRWRFYQFLDSQMDMLESQECFSDIKYRKDFILDIFECKLPWRNENDLFERIGKHIAENYADEYYFIEGGMLLKNFTLELNNYKEEK